MPNAKVSAGTFYTATGLPNPDVVNFYMAETGCSSMVNSVELNVGLRENRTPEMLAINPLGEVPSLVTAGGLHIAESVAICKYLDEIQGCTSLFGTLLKRGQRL